MNTVAHNFIAALVMALAVPLLSACNGGSGGDVTAPAAAVSPANGATISASSGAIVITFNEPMDTASLVLGGNMAPLSDGGTWSSAVAGDDTLTIRPTGEWLTGIGNLTVSVSDVAGNALSSLDLSYLIPLLLDNFQAAALVIGQADFSGQAPNQGGPLPAANTLAFATRAPNRGSLYLADDGNHRILGFDAVPSINNANASFVLGQDDFTTANSGIAANSFSVPASAVTAQGKLLVCDTSNHRVLIWNTLPASNVPANVVLGAGDFTTPGGGTSRTMMNVPISLSVAGGRLFVADRLNNRVLIWNSIPVNNNSPADIVVGQVDFTTSTPGLSAVKLNRPSDVWSDGQRLVVADTDNRRVLIWNTIPAQNGAAADLVIGQPDFNTQTIATTSRGLDTPFGVHSNGLQLFIADTFNNRVLIFDSFPTSSHQAADRVLGQSSFTNSRPDDDDQDGSVDANPSARTLDFPMDINTIGNQLFVTDNANHRVLIYQGN